MPDREMYIQEPGGGDSEAVTATSITGGKKLVPRYSVSKKKAKVAALIAVASVIVLVLITRFASKTNCDTSKDSTSRTRPQRVNLKLECSKLYCQNTSILNEWKNECASTSPQTGGSHETVIRRRDINYRLPTDLKPYFYEIIVKPYFNVTQAPSTYYGHVTIKFSCLKNTNKLVLHSHSNINITAESFELTSLTQDTISVVNGLRNQSSHIRTWYYQPETQFLVIEMNREYFVANNNYSVSIEFTGSLLDDNAGFYRSSYLDNQGKKRWLMASQMEPTDARKSFICFDEPELKARFKIRVIHDSSLSVLSNMPVKSVNYLNIFGSYNWTQTDFYETVEMSTYLVAVIVSDFKCIQSTAHPVLSRSVSVAVCARPNALEQLGLALNASVQLLEFFESYYNVTYPLPKLDHVALPDFNSGAMENWGLITYRESALLYDRAKTSQGAEQYIVEVIAHEIAHQWFGNLVTMKWWNDLWLNEGFARYMQFVGAAAARPEWEMKVEMTGLAFNIMNLDSVSTSHPISVDVDNPDDINQIFDGITYGKGGSVLRMMNYFLGQSVFKNGLTEYLSKYKYSNTIQDNLWQSLQQRGMYENKMTSMSLTRVMNTWTKQMGHPLVTVEILNTTHFAISQEHFLFDSTAKPDRSDYNYKWYVPFTYTVEELSSSANSIANRFDIRNTHEHVIWLEPTESRKIIKLDKELKENNFILANLDVSGFYRVIYPDNNWKLITEQLVRNNRFIPSNMRAHLINDAFGLNRANRITAIHTFQIISYLDHEKEYLPWSTFLNQVSYYVNIFELTESFGYLQKYLIDTITPIYVKLGWDSSPHDTWLDRKLRSAVVRFSCMIGVPDCIHKANEMYREWMEDRATNKIPKDFRSFVYCTAIRHGSRAEWDFASNEYDLESDANTKRSLQFGMSCSREPWLIMKYLNNQLNEAKVRRQDALIGLRYALRQSYSNKIGWVFLKNNWNSLVQKFGTSKSLGYLLSDVTDKFFTQDYLSDFVNFFQNAPLKTAANEYKVSQEKIKANIFWIKKNFESLSGWLKNRTQVKTEEKLNYRLPGNVKPYSYEIQIKPYIGDSSVYGSKAFTFDGLTNISVKCLNATNKIVLHTKNMEVQSVRVYQSSQRLLGVLDFDYDTKLEFMTINLEENCQPNRDYKLSFTYVGQIDDSLAGFYRSSYVDSDGKTQIMASTQFEPTDARRAFPSFDEPSMKARFKISILRHAKFFNSSYSNMPMISSQRLDDDYEWVLDQFEESVPMSTYLVAFAVANYKLIQKNSPKYNVLVEVAAKPQSIDSGHGDFALQEASQIIDHYSDYFGTKYPLKKSTQIAIPDFSAGAMENWGLVTYREKYLLFNASSDPVLNKKSISLVVAHELAHQWFGNLVTPIWWNDLWLNEGFASWVEYLGVNHTHPEWKFLNYFYGDKLDVLHKDSLVSSHPISSEVNDPTEIVSLFDEISYDKGSCMVRMMNSFLTIDTFKAGISRYLKKYEMSNANQDNLWEELTLQGHFDETLDQNLTIKEIMDSWTLKKGYPVVHVDRVVNRNNNTLTLRLHQTWFLLDPLNSMRDSIHDYKWYIPFTFTTKSSLNFAFESRPHWLRPEQESYEVGVASAGRESAQTDWVVGNLQFAGFYRVNYDLDNWNLLIQQLTRSHEQISLVNRAQLISDSFNLANAEFLDHSIFLRLLSNYLVNETEYLPFRAAREGLNYLDDMFISNYTVYKLFQEFTKNVFLKTYNRLGWRTIDDVTQISLQIEAVRSMCLAGHADCVEKSRTYFNNWINKNQPIPNNFKTIVYQTVIKYGNDQEWFYLFDKCVKTNVNSEKILMISGLSRTQNYNLLKLLLQKSSDRNFIKNQDETNVIEIVSGNAISKSIVYDYICENWERLNQKFSNSLFSLNEMIVSIFENYNTKYELEKIERFIQLYMRGTPSSSLKEVIENAKTNIRWMDVNFKLVGEWIVKHFNKS